MNYFPLALLSILSAASGPNALARQTPPFEQGEVIAARVVDPTGVALFDYDGDGDKDLLLVGFFAGEIHWQENIGNDLLGVARPVNVSTERAASIHVFDYGADGSDDLLVVEQRSPSNVLVVLGSAPGGGLEVVHSSVIPGQGTGQGASTLEVTDADGDGDDDAVINSFAFSSVVEAIVAFQEPQGEFTFVVANPTAPFGTEFTTATGDVTNNGLKDVVVRVDVSDLGYAPQVSPGVFGPSVVIGEAHGNGPPDDIEVFDFNGDGDLDVFAAFGELDFLYLYRNRNGNSFRPRLEVPAGGRGARWMEQVDMDGDGDTDLLMATNTAGMGLFSWLENTGVATDFVVRSTWTLGGPDWSFVEVSLDDWNGDGFEDLFVIRDTESGASHQAEVYLGQGAGAGALAFAPSPMAITDPLFALKDLGALDVDGDGDLDLLTSARFSPTTVSINVGPGRFERPVPLAGLPSDGRFMATGDIDGDGRRDGVISTQTGRLFWFRNLHAGAMSSSELGFTSTSYNDRPSLADVDGDGDLDVVAVNPSAQELMWYEQTSPGSFAGGATYLAFLDALVDFEIADMDSDGVLDVTVIRRISNSTVVYWYRGLGAQSFAVPVPLATGGTEGANLRIADLDEDGTLDAVWYRSFGREVVCVFGLGAGTFSAPSVVAATSGRGRCMEVVASPVGGVDLAVGTQRPSTALLDRVEWFRSNGGGTFAPAEGVDELLLKPRALLAADLDQDGDIDLVSATEDDGRIQWYAGRRVPEIGERFCSAAVANSNGRVGRISAVGSDLVLSNELRLVARDVRPNIVTLFLASQTQASVPMAGGSSGTLCLGGSVGRFLLPGQAGLANGDGLRDLTVDLTQIPEPGGFASAAAGETWSFQAWHRDVVAGALTSNFTDAIAVTFL